jgi:hypothetical protein
LIFSLAAGGLTRGIGALDLITNGKIKSEVAQGQATSKLSLGSDDEIIKLDTPSRRRPVKAVTSPSGKRRRGGSPIDNKNWRARPTAIVRPSVSFVENAETCDPFLAQGWSACDLWLFATADVIGTLSDKRGTRVRASSASGSLPSKNEASPTAGTPTSSFRPREDRKIVEISGDNAQALFPPSSCVFVAK